MTLPPVTGEELLEGYERYRAPAEQNENFLLGGHAIQTWSKVFRVLTDVRSFVLSPDVDGQKVPDYALGKDNDKCNLDPNRAERHAHFAHDFIDLKAAADEQILKTVFASFANAGVRPTHIDIQPIIPRFVSWHDTALRSVKFPRLEQLQLNPSFSLSSIRPSIKSRTSRPSAQPAHPRHGPDNSRSRPRALEMLRSRAQNPRPRMRHH